ncbi:MAG TPA: hypothetical protein DCZ72_11985, partial [Armatimonadetes bacterium]|nr:hypothetical protein [Armatimonadota bacterium]
VIAIIAILAAILFPVFAKAREKARQTSCSSNLKQLALAFIQYAQDYDECFPTHRIWNHGPHWQVGIAPYLKNWDIYRCPSDGGWPDWIGPAQGAICSYVANCYYKGDDYIWTGQPDDGFPPHGVISLGDFPGWLKAPQSMAAIQRPADTIMLGEKSNSDIAKAGAEGGWHFNTTAEWCQDMIMGPGQGGGWGYQDAPDATRVGVWPNGPEGGVSAPHSEMGNFAFIDGHVKAMRPRDTNPDPVNRPGDNMWSGLRR